MLLRDGGPYSGDRARGLDRLVSQLDQSWISLRICGGQSYGGGCVVAWVCVEKMPRQPSARPSLYTPEEAEGRNTLGTALILLAEVGGGCSAGEASPLTWRRLRKRCLIASIGVLEKMHRSRSLLGGPVGEASGHAT
jgi:hypothetical protein